MLAINCQILLFIKCLFLDFGKKHKKKKRQSEASEELVLGW